MTAVLDSAGTTARTVPQVLELELTNRCQLTCDALCFVQAGPTKGHGTMSADEWKDVISQASGLGVQRIKLIGGEPTLHPHFGELLEHGLAEGLQVIVYSNLFRVREEYWRLFERPGVTLATSYYADTDENTTRSLNGPDRTPRPGPTSSRPTDVVSRFASTSSTSRAGSRPHVLAPS